MPGLFGIKPLNFDVQHVNFGTIVFEQNSKDGLLNESADCGGMYIERHLSKKFRNDKVFQRNDKYFIAIDGIVLNSRRLIKKYNSASFFDAIISLYEEFGQAFIPEMNGNFCGVFSDIENDTHMIFNNIAGSKNLFYSFADGKVVFGSDVNYVIEYFKSNGLQYTFNEKAAKSMLGHKFLYDDATFFNEIKRLLQGFCVVIKNNAPEIIQYYDYIRGPVEGRSEKELINGFDKVFRRAVKRAFEKDREYGYEHIACLSSGLDCRMTTWVAHELGYSDNITNITYSQPDYWDEVVPKQMAQDMGHKFIYQSLANGLFSLNIDGNVRDNGGSYCYMGIAQGKEAFSRINMDRFGLIHSGLFSDLARGRFCWAGSSSFDLGAYYNANTNKYLNDFFSPEEESRLEKRYNNTANYLLYMIGNISENTQFTGLSGITEPYSPFFDKDVLEYCLKVPVENLKDSELYNKWIIQKYPEAASYVYDKINAPLNERTVTIPWNKKVSLPISRLPRYLKTKIKRRLLPWIEQKYIASNDKTGHMNPMDYWYSASKRYKETFDGYFNENIERLSFNNELYTGAKDVYLNTSGKWLIASKAQVLTILSVLKNYF